MKPIIGVMGSGTEPYEEIASEIAREIAKFDAFLLTGGGPGVMASVAKHYKLAKPNGVTIGVLPNQHEGSKSAPQGYPNQWIDVAIQTHLPFSGEKGTSHMSRNHINILSSSAIIALPGGLGTTSEIRLACRYEQPIIVFHGPYPVMANLPGSVRQTADIEMISAFLQQHIK